MEKLELGFMKCFVFFVRINTQVSIYTYKFKSIM